MGTESLVSGIGEGYDGVGFRTYEEESVGLILMDCDMTFLLFLAFYNISVLLLFFIYIVTVGTSLSSGQSCFTFLLRVLFCLIYFYVVKITQI